MKLLSIILALLVTLTGVIYIASVLYEKSGSFTVSVNKYEMQKYGLSLSESSDMTRPSSSLNANVAEKMTNIAGETIDKNVDMIDGEHNGRDYIAYTFYVQNAGEVEVSYDIIYECFTFRSDIYPDGTFGCHHFLQGFNDVPAFEYTVCKRSVLKFR